MADNFGTMYRELRLWCPQVPIFLAKKMIRDRYRRIIETRPWSGLRAEGEVLLNTAVEAGTVNLVRGNSTVTGVGTSWTSAVVGRQFMAGNRAPVYTVSSVNVGLQTLVLDRVFGGTTINGTNYRILDAYVSMPSDFVYFLTVIDPFQQWRLRHWITLEELARIDPARTTAGTPWVVVDRRFNSSGQPQYEWWPYTTAERNYPFYYIKRPADFVDDATTPIFPVRTDVIVRGALADLARWPGTTDNPNPMYGKALELSRSFEAEYKDMLIELERQDESIYMTWLKDANWSTWPLAPIDARFYQNHAF